MDVSGAMNAVVDASVSMPFGNLATVSGSVGSMMVLDRFVGKATSRLTVALVQCPLFAGIFAKHGLNQAAPAGAMCAASLIFGLEDDFNRPSAECVQAVTKQFFYQKGHCMLPIAKQLLNQEMSSLARMEPTGRSTLDGQEELGIRSCSDSFVLRNHTKDLDDIYYQLEKKPAFFVVEQDRDFTFLSVTKEKATKERLESISSGRFKSAVHAWKREISENCPTFKDRVINMLPFDLERHLLFLRYLVMQNILNI